MKDEVRICVQKVGGIWHGTIEGHPEIDERGLTKEIAERKAREAAGRIQPATAKPTSSTSRG
jgi:hypothetical protein